MQVFVSGVWSEKKAAPYAAQAFELGQLLARLGYDLASGPGTGISRYVIDGYRSIQPRGTVRFYLPAAGEMEKVGEVVGEGADEIIETDLDYPMRNILQVRSSQGVVIVTGGDGTLEEAITALADYEIPVAALRKSGTAATALELLVTIYPQWQPRLKIGDSVNELVDFIARTAAESGKVGPL